MCLYTCIFVYQIVIFIILKGISSFANITLIKGRTVLLTKLNFCAFYNMEIDIRVSWFISWFTCNTKNRKSRGREINIFLISLVKWKIIRITINGTRTTILGKIKCVSITNIKIRSISSITFRRMVLEI